MSCYIARSTSARSIPMLIVLFGLCATASAFAPAKHVLPRGVSARPSRASSLVLPSTPRDAIEEAPRFGGVASSRRAALAAGLSVVASQTVTPALAKYDGYATSKDDDDKNATNATAIIPILGTAGILLAGASAAGSSAANSSAAGAARAAKADNP